MSIKTCKVLICQGSEQFGGTPGIFARASSRQKILQLHHYSMIVSSCLGLSDP